MDAPSDAEEPEEIDIPAPDLAAASRYIAAIVARDPRAPLGTGYCEWQTRQLWIRFVAEYTSIALGPYARHGGAAARLALGRL